MCRQLSQTCVTARALVTLFNVHHILPMYRLTYHLSSGQLEIIRFKTCFCILNDVCSKIYYLKVTPLFTVIIYGHRVGAYRDVIAIRTHN